MRGERRHWVIAAFLAGPLLAAPAQGPPVAEPVPPPAPAAPPEIAWLDWSEDSFARASAESKPILLNVEARWSRATLWVEEKILRDPEVVRLANEKWIPIRIDRDRRPDVDLRYQLAVDTLNPGQASLPLTAFLLDNGEALFGGSIIPVEDRFDRRGMRYLLERNAGIVKLGPEVRAGQRQLVRLAFDREAEVRGPGRIELPMVRQVAEATLEEMDREMGGFGPPPRYLPPHILELLATLYHRTGEPDLLEALSRTLEGIERGAINDRVGGGLHRLATDRAWRMPEFEKLLNYNAPMLTDFLLGWQAAGREEFRRTAEGITDYLLRTLADPEGGFYVGQWAAASADEAKGIYYSWEAEEFSRLIPEGLDRIARTLFNVKPEGEIALGPPARNLLYVTMGRDEAARRLGVTEEAVRRGEAALIDALARSRAARVPPPVERAVYVDSSSAAVVALLEAGRVLGREDARAAALTTLERLIAAVPQGSPLRHRVQPPPDPRIDPPLALDHLMLARAALDGYEATADARWLSSARDLVERAVALFWGPDGGGFLDIAADPAARGYLTIRRRLPADTAYPSLNSLAARVLDRLWLHTREPVYRTRAEACLRSLASITGDLSAEDSGLALAVESHLRTPTRYVIVGPAEDPSARGLRASAERLFDPGKAVLHLAPGRDDAAIEALGLRRSEEPYAAVCRGERCSAPLRDEAALRENAAEPRAEPGGASR